MENNKSTLRGLGRRDFLGKMGMGLGSVALWSLLNPVDVLAATKNRGNGGILRLPHHAPKAKRVIYLFQSGGPAQQDLFDYKPMLRKLNGQELPGSVRQGQRLTGMSAFQSSLPLAGSISTSNNTGRMACGSAIFCLIRPKSLMNSALSNQCIPKPSTMTLPSPFFRPAPNNQAGHQSVRG